MAAVLTARSMRLSDVPAVAAIEAETFPNPFTPQMLRDDLANAARHYLIIEDATAGIIAYGGMMLEGDVGHVITLATVEAKRGKGLGTLLLVDLIDWTIRRGAVRLTLEVHTGNRSAIRLYERFGFAPVGIRRNYYRDGDALIMWAHEVAGPEYRARLSNLKVADE